MRKTVLIGLFVFVLLAASQVNAIETVTPTTTEDSSVSTTLAVSPTVKPTLKTLQNPLRNALTTAKQGVVKTFQERRDAAKTEFKEARDAFKEKVDAMKDTRKQAILERVDERINNLNEHDTEKLDNHVTQLSTILEKIKTKAADAKKAGQDTTAVDSAVTTAETSVDAARTAVDAQADKDYVIDFTTDSEVRVQAAKVAAEFKIDIKTTHQAVMKAHMDVVSAAQALAKIKLAISPTGAMHNEESTPAAHTSPTAP